MRASAVLPDREVSLFAHAAVTHASPLASPSLRHARQPAHEILHLARRSEPKMVVEKLSEDAVLADSLPQFPSAR